MRYRLGLDFGTNSLGWAIVELNDQNRPIRLIRLGSRIYSDGRNPKELATPSPCNAAARARCGGNVTAIFGGATVSCRP